MSERHAEISVHDLGKRAVAEKNTQFFAFSISWTRLSWSLEQARYDPESIITGLCFRQNVCNFCWGFSHYSNHIRVPVT